MFLDEDLREKPGYYAVIALISFILGALWIAFVDTRPFSDFDYYYNLAVQIANGGAWGDTYTSVGYSIVLGGIFKLFGASVLAAKLFNLLLTLLNNVLFFNILKKTSLKSKDRKIVFTLFALLPNNIFFINVVGTEIMFTCMILAITALYFSEIKSRFIWIGLLVGFGSIVKPFLIAIAFGLFLVELIKDRTFFKALKNSITVLVIAVIAIAPWIYRNTRYMGQFTSISNNGGIVLYINNNSTNTKGRWMSSDEVENSITITDEYKNANRTQQNKMLGDAAKSWIKSHPKRFVELGGLRLYNTYFAADDVQYSMHGSNLSDSVKNRLTSWSTWLRYFIFIPAMISMLACSVIVVARIFNGTTDQLDKFSLYCLIVFYMFTCVYFVTEGQSRYSFPVFFIGIYFSHMFFKKLVTRWTA